MADMTAQPELSFGAAVDEKKGMPFTRYVMIGAGILIGIVLLLLIAAVVIAIANPAGAAGFFEYVRNLLLIVLTIQGILIITALALLLIQLARFVNLLRSEAQPLASDTREAMRNVKVTTQFASREAVGPIIKTQSFMSGLFVFTREIFKIGRLVRRKSNKSDEG